MTTPGAANSADADVPVPWLTTEQMVEATVESARQYRRAAEIA